MKQPIKLPFGLNENNVLVHIANVEKGKECNCVCPSPSCRSPLVAAKGDKNQHHFKHAVVNECEGGLESAIHLATKQMILAKKQITLPKCIVSASKKDSRGIKYTEQKTILENGVVVQFDFVEEEKEIHGMKVDVLAKKNNIPLIIEIFYRHKVDDQKRVKIAGINISAIEINLSDLTAENLKDYEIFWSYINDPQRVQWIHYTKARHKELALQEELERKIQEKEEKYKQEETEAQERTKKEVATLLDNLKVQQRNKYPAPDNPPILNRPSLRRGPPPIDLARLSNGKLKKNQNQPFGRKKFRF